MLDIDAERFSFPEGKAKDISDFYYLHGHDNTLKTIQQFL
jgi:hypothetical protein